MMSLRNVLPPAKQPTPTSTFYDHSNDLQRFIEPESKIFSDNSVPIYLKRQSFRPRKPEDFGDGGAFPEIHVSQCPLGMGSVGTNKHGSKILPVSVDAHGNLVFDGIVRQNENSKKIVYSQHSDLIPKTLKNEGDHVDEDDDLEKKTTEETKAAFEKIVNASQPNNVVKQSGDSKIIKYKPSQQSSSSFNSGAKERIVRVSEMPTDPLDPPRFKHKRVPVASGSENPVPKGYTIPLDKRLAADGRALQEAQVNDKFAKLSESLYVAEQISREAVSMRSKIQSEMVMKEKERKEQELRDLALKARSERTSTAASESGIEREKIREERRRERERGREGWKVKMHPWVRRARSQGTETVT
ncbi:unnamed protein product [Microthlaspi erraticum]|uniref:SKI-interacting protein SKIP SNW domain-containing protein n=1 Tax=Microthlaspi erraticum TaxID=1685480 RepID=A0A6D2IPU4_9BRAS|nr:unnamed protein product [Microthlaspi erraticum]